MLSINYPAWAFTMSVLIIRLVFGLIMLINHGIPKLMKFSTLQPKFYAWWLLDSKWSLILVIFAEVFCSLFIILGLFTRLAAIPLVITMLVACFGAHATDTLVVKEMSILYLTVFSALLLLGAGKVSVDGMLK